jgi:hypothetical protein
MADVFISYKREDCELVRPLARCLQQRGFTVWWDSRIETGENWIACIKRALDAANCVIVVWTPQSVGADRNYLSEMIAVEANEGWQRGILLPVRMQNGPRGFPHNLRNEEDLSDWSSANDDPALERLAGRIADFSGERGTPAPAELAAWLDAEEANNATAFHQFGQAFPHSRFTEEVELRAAEAEQRAVGLQISIDAALRIVEQFSSAVSKPSFTPAIQFGLGRVDRDNAIAFTREELFDRLANGEKAILQAEPGGGKTVALLEWANNYSVSREERIGVFIRLKELVGSDDLFAHLECLESTDRVSSGAWKRMAQSGILTVFCDGWNELSDDERTSVGSLLNIHVRTFPSSGLVVGSRPLAPAALSGDHLLLFLRRLTWEQVKAVVESRLPGNSAAALAELRQSAQLRDLVRTPFFLVAFCATRQAGEAPTTREGLIRGMVIAGEQEPQHAETLRRVFGGQQEKFLTGLAVEMLSRQQIELTNDDARIVINRVSRELLEADLLTERIDARMALDTLRDHHCLMEHAGDGSSFRFQHQLINEWYASNEVRRVALHSLSDEAARKRLDQEILNQRTWTEAIDFAVQKPLRNDDDIVATSYLILRTIGIDPLFAADLIAVAPETVWERIAPAVRSFVEQWYSSSREDTVGFVLHCGKDEFAEIVWDAVQAQETDHVSQVLDRTDFLHPHVLGSTWKEKCAALNNERRASFLVLLASSGSLEGAKMAVEVAKSDKAPEAQSRVAEMLDFYRFYDELTELLNAAQPETWGELVRKRNIDGLWEEPWRDSAIAALKRVFSKTPPGPQRIDYALRLRSLDEDVEIDLVAELLATKLDNHHYEDELYRKVAEVEGDRLSAAIIESLLQGNRVTYRASRYIKQGAEINQDQLIIACKSEENKRRHEDLSPLLNFDSLKTLFSELLAAHREWLSLVSKERQASADRFGILQDALIHADKNVLAEMILDLTPSDPVEIGTASEIVMRGFRSEYRHDERTPLRPDLRDRLIERLGEWSGRLVADASCSRNALHNLAEAVATFPSKALLSPLRSLLSADLSRWRDESEEFQKRRERGKQPEPGSGARMSYAFRYGQNMLSLATGRNPDFADDGDEREQAPASQEMTEAAIDVLSDFLLDDKFGDEAARVIATLRSDPISKIGEARRIGGYDLSVVPERRKARQIRDVEPVDPIAKRLLDAIDELRKTNTSESLKHAVKLSLAVVRMNCGESTDSISALIIEHGSLEDISRLMMLRLLFGRELDSTVIVRCLDELDGRRSEHKWEYDENWYKWQELLVLLIFADEPVAAARRLLGYEPRGRNHDERQIIDALGLCLHPDALEALNTLHNRCVEQRMEYEWCAAVGAIASPEAGEILLSNLAEGPRGGDSHRRRHVSETIAKLAHRHKSVWQKIVSIASKGDVSEIGIVADIIRHVTSEDMIVDIVSLSADRLNRLTGAISDALRDVCVERRPIPGQSGLSDLVPRPVDRLRAKLFVRVQANDEGSSACVKLLNAIDHWRDDYGAPYEEERHPDIASGAPWPQIAHSAWEAASEILR